ncbi:hypothetical protein SAMN04488168_1022 [Bacillus sp. 491mf]|uniref:PIN-like domain-containing protein n=1 Tax=Bacillus sp. 491mf TaxID=1761755 RepID=UPI0008EF72FA|nr:PIN-like domain-containing protein [Bacillus sp. 491mf]SFC09637.1 hypothetical protein SAMN04488168_1022 [Bacillus sp. 491mf]
MKTVFPEFYKYNQEEFKNIFDNCYFVIDANVLLNLYRYSEPTANKLLEILEKISDRLWMPYQVGLEFHSNRVNVILEQQIAYDNICGKIDSQATEFISKFKKGFNSRHPKIHTDVIAQKMQDSFDEIIAGLKQDKEQHPNFLNEDSILDSLNKLYENKIGNSYTQGELEKIYKEGEDRYKKKFPPGFEDEKDKKDQTKEYNGVIYQDKFGDLVVWKQIIDKAKNDNKSMIFVTDDVKPDWWQIEKGRTIGPRIELLNEFRRETDVSFYMYKSEQFMNQVQGQLREKVSEIAIKEIEDLRESSVSSESEGLKMSEKELEIMEKFSFYTEEPNNFYNDYSEALMKSIIRDLMQLRTTYLPSEREFFYKLYQDEYYRLTKEKELVDSGLLEAKEYANQLEIFQEKVEKVLKERIAYTTYEG